MLMIASRYYIPVCMILTLASSSYAAVLTPESKIKSVTVYPDSVLVTRSATVDLSVGEHSVNFENIIPEIDENSLSVSGSGSADVKLSGAYIKREYLQQSPDERIKDITSQIETLQDQIQQEASHQGALDAQKEFLQSVKLFSGNQIPKDLVTKMPATTDLENVLSFLGTQLNNVEKQKDDLRVKIRGLHRQMQVLEKQLNDLRGSGAQQLRRSIVANLTCQKTGKLNLTVSYLVRGVSWYPLYDARVLFQKDQVELTSFGVIQQTTGEDWDNVELTLSTAKPSIGGRLPYVSPWVLRPYQPVPQARRAMMKSGVAGSVTQMPMQMEAMNAPADLDAQEAPEEDKLAEMAYSEVESKGISIVYKLPGQITVKSDGTEHKFPISTQSLKAEFQYTAYPRVSPFVYLGSRVTNDKDLQLLAGQVNVFLDNDFIGKSSIDNIGSGENFDLYLGVDENVKVERKEIEKKVDDVLIAGIPSPNRKTTFQYRLTAENYKNKPIEMILFEAMPVSENERIKTKVTDVSLSPKDKDWKNRSGIWRWELELKPQAKQEIFYSFFVEHPRDMTVDGL